MMFRIRRSIAAALLAVPLLAIPVTPIAAADWPTWRFDAGRTARSPERLPEKLHLQWTRDLGPLRPAFGQARQERVHFDRGYEPVVMGKTLVFGSSRNDCVTALDTDTGSEKWRRYLDGPVRLAPALAHGRVYVAGDDGCLWCLSLDNGEVLWKVRGAPSQRTLLGNGRLISAWPARGGPVVDGDRVYFAAGIWPFEGIFVYALDARTGKTLWCNDRTGSLYLEHPHGAMSFGGPSPQGYLMIHQGRLVVPSSRAFPAFFDLETGQLDHFEFGHGGHGSRPGSWFVASDANGRLLVDPEINTEIHDAGPQVIGQSGVRRKPGEALQETVSIGKETYHLRPAAAGTIELDGRTIRFRDGLPGVDGAVHTVVAADEKLFAVSREGRLYCLGPKPQSPKRHPMEQSPQPTEGKPPATHGDLLAAVGKQEGYAVICGWGDGSLVNALLKRSRLQHLIVIEPDANIVDRQRRQLDSEGLYGDRVVVHAGDAGSFDLPPYLASLIVCPKSPPFRELGIEFDATQAIKHRLTKLFPSVRPYGGMLALASDCDIHDRDGLSAFADLHGAQMKRQGDWLLATRPGGLPGAADYAGQANLDRLVRAPLGLLWFGDTLHHHKLFDRGFTPESPRGLPGNIQVRDGEIQYLVGKEPHGPNPTSLSYRDYLQQLDREKAYLAGRVDVYTGRVIDQVPADRLPVADLPATVNAVEPPGLTRRNPITGIEEAREFLKTYGCDQFAADYGGVLTMRSGTAAFYDKRLESGTINISGTRSGCRNSMVPACGVLSVPSWTGNCTCNYPLYTSLALVPMPADFEQWSAWGGLAVDAPIQRLGINFGAPGDRMTEEGTLWVDWPSVGGPSPEITVQVEPKDARPFYRHSMAMQREGWPWHRHNTHRAGGGWPWVFASGIEGVRRLRVETVARRSGAPGTDFSIRWTGFLLPPSTGKLTLHARSDRSLRVWLDDRAVLDNARNVRRSEAAETAASVETQAGKKIRVMVEYFGPRTKTAPPQVSLDWSAADRPKQPIPSDRLLAPDGKPGGLAGVYYDNAQMNGPALLRVDPQMTFDWSDGPPEPIVRQRTRAQAVERSYTVRLFFAEPEPMAAGTREFSVEAQGVERLSGVGAGQLGVVKEIPGVKAKEAIELRFLQQSERPPLVCGLELIAEE